MAESEGLAIRSANFGGPVDSGLLAPLVLLARVGVAVPLDEPHRLLAKGARLTPPIGGRNGVTGPWFSGRAVAGPRGGDRSRAGREGG